MSYIGQDESGKGDYFGPLVIGSICIEDSHIPILEKLGVQDSKKLSDKRNIELASYIKKLVPYTVIQVYPIEYNEVYAKIQNLNTLLSEYHIMALRIMIEKAKAECAIIDQFSSKKMFGPIPIIQRIHGEEDIAVAGASILARAGFLLGLKALQERYGLLFPKGAGAPIYPILAQYISTFGSENLNRVAKVHFRNTKAL